MFNFNLVAKQKDENLLTLTMTIGFRVMFFAIAVFVALGLYSAKTVAIFPIIILSISVLAGLYNETWYFNRNTDTVEHRFGLLFLFKRKQYTLSEIRQVEIRSFTRGSLTTSMKAREHASSDGDTQSSTEDPNPFKRGGRMLSPMLLNELNLRLNDNESVNIEMMKARNNDQFYQKAELISTFLNRPLVDIE